MLFMETNRKAARVADASRNGAVVQRRTVDLSEDLVSRAIKHEAIRVPCALVHACRRAQLRKDRVARDAGVD